MPRPRKNPEAPTITTAQKYRSQFDKVQGQLRVARITVAGLAEEIADINKDEYKTMQDIRATIVSLSSQLNDVYSNVFLDD